MTHMYKNRSPRRQTTDWRWWEYFGPKRNKQ